MFVSPRNNIEKKHISEHIVKQILIGPEQGWDDYVMRLFTLEQKGKAPHHSHPWQHVIFAVEGEGNLLMDGKDYALTSGSVAYVPEGIDHQVSNAGTQQFVFICIVPKRGDV
ncbi:MAG: cupin domain-containing protein [Sphaerochaetaceae bacterium]